MLKYLYLGFALSVSMQLQMSEFKINCMHFLYNSLCYEFAVSCHSLYLSCRQVENANTLPWLQDSHLNECFNSIYIILQYLFTQSICNTLHVWYSDEFVDIHDQQLGIVWKSVLVLFNVISNFSISYLINYMYVYITQTVRLSIFIP